MSAGSTGAGASPPPREPWAASSTRGHGRSTSPLSPSWPGSRNGAGTGSCGTSGPPFFPPRPRASAAALALLVPLLAVPQSTHDVLDAWIWRLKGNPGLGRYLGLGRD